MAGLSSTNPLKYVIERQYQEKYLIKNKLFKERLAKAKNLFKKDLVAHYGCVNAIEFSVEGDLLVSGGDDRRVLLWSVSQAMYGNRMPTVMHTNHNSNIFCLTFDSVNTKIFSGGNDDQVIIHDTKTGHLLGKLPHESPVYGLSINPTNDDILATAADEGKIRVFDVRESPNASEALCLASESAGFHSVKFHPTNPRLLVTANSGQGIVLWDCRKPKEFLIHYDESAGINACFNATGSQILALRRRLPPVLYAVDNPNAVCQFYHPRYYNSCTMKTCCFAGDDDEYILSGSDDFDLYMWRVPADDSEWGKTHLVLRGHRSIVNQVRYNGAHNLIASSGVEKIIKLWTPLPIGTWKGSLQKENWQFARNIYSHDDYIDLVGHGGGRISHDYSEHSIQEDSKMLAFFDSLIQREIEGWESSTEKSLSNCSDSESDGDNHNVLNVMYTNKRFCMYENRITKLISKKRDRLAKMAYKKATSQLKRCYLREKKSLKKKPRDKIKQAKQKKPSKKSSNKRTKEKPEKKSAKRKYRTRQSVRDHPDSNSNNSLDAPSTSTGITRSNSRFRVVEQDSDEDQGAHAANCNEHGGEPVPSAAANFVNILPTPLNGTHDMFINVLEMSSRAASPTRSPETVASTSNGGASRCASDNRYESDSDTDYEYDYNTPVKRMRTISASDSGCGTGPCSSTNSFRSLRYHQQQCSSNSLYSNNNNEIDSDDEYKYEKFKKRVKKAMTNIRKQIGGCDSDSN